MDEKSMFGYTPNQYKKFRKYAWRALIGFSVLYCFLYCERLNLSSAMPLMMEEEGWTSAQLGILSSVFFWVYGVGHLVNGRLGEIIGVNRFVVLGVILAAIVNIAISFQTSLIVITILWGVNGFVQSMVWSPGMALLAKWWTGKSRGFATGFANAFSGFGQAVAMIVVLISFKLAPTMGWRAAFIFPVLTAAFMAIVYSFIVKEKPEKVGLPAYKDSEKNLDAEQKMEEVLNGKSKIYPYIYLVKQWKFDIWLLLIALSNVARYGLLTWIPLYFTNSMGIDIESSLIGSLLLPVGMGIGTLVIPSITDKYCAENRFPAVIICAIVGGLSMFALMFTQNMILISTLLFIAGFFLYAINGMVWAFALDVGGRQFSGTASGMLEFVAYIGASLQAILFGFAVGNGNWNMLFVVCAAVSFCMVFLSFIAQKGTVNQNVNMEEKLIKQN